MSLSDGVSPVETLECRAYASVTFEPVSTTKSVVENDPHPSAVVVEYGSRITTLTPDALVDDDGILRIHGTSGDDSFRLRPVHGRLQLITYTRESYHFSKRPTQRVLATTTVEQTFDITGANLSAASIEGNDGTDSVRIRGLTFNPEVYSVESAAVTPFAAAAGETPSDPNRSGRFRPGLGWDARATFQQALADKSHATLAFFGDSHAERFPTVGHYAWQAQFPRALALGIGGDSTRQLLTRVEDGLFDTFKPETLVVSVGSNNFLNPTTAGTDKQIYRGVLAVMHALRAKLPDSKLILIGLLPRTGAGLNERVQTLNHHLAATAEANEFYFVNVYDRFADHPVRNTVALAATDSHYTGVGYKALSYLLYDLIRTP